MTSAKSVASGMEKRSRNCTILVEPLRFHESSVTRKGTWVPLYIPWTSLLLSCWWPLQLWMCTYALYVYMYMYVCSKSYTNHSHPYTYACTSLKCRYSVHVNVVVSWCTTCKSYYILLYVTFFLQVEIICLDLQHMGNFKLSQLSYLSTCTL